MSQAAKTFGLLLREQEGLLLLFFFKAAATALKEEVQLLKIYTITLTVEERNNILLKAVYVL